MRSAQSMWRYLSRLSSYEMSRKAPCSPMTCLSLRAVNSCRSDALDVKHFIWHCDSISMHRRTRSRLLKLRCCDRCDFGGLPSRAFRIWLGWWFLFIGEEDARVLTLAEQIIAALPERIKRAEGDSPSSSSPPPLTAPLSPLEDALMEQMVRVSCYYYC